MAIPALEAVALLSHFPVIVLSKVTAPLTVTNPQPPVTPVTWAEALMP